MKKVYTLRDDKQPSPTRADYVWTTYSVLGYHFRFQGRLMADGLWYVHVCLLKLGQWVRVSYGYLPGKTLPQAAESWALAYARKPVQF